MIQAPDLLENILPKKKTIPILTTKSVPSCCDSFRPNQLGGGPSYPHCLLFAWGLAWSALQRRWAFSYWDLSSQVRNITNLKNASEPFSSSLRCHVGSVRKWGPEKHEHHSFVYLISEESRRSLYWVCSEKGGHCLSLRGESGDLPGSPSFVLPAAYRGWLFVWAYATLFSHCRGT